MTERNHGNIVANTLDFYRERIKDSGASTPQEYLDIKEKLETAMLSGKRVLVNVRDSYNLQVAVLQLHYVQERWAMGYSICYMGREEVKVPYTVHYSDIYSQRTKIKLIVEGEDPFG